VDDATRVIRVDGLPEAPLAAAAHFHAAIVPAIEAQDAPVVTLVLPEADHTHRGWRVAALGALARVLAPARINAVAGGDPHQQARAIAFIEQAPGLTGQLLPLDGPAGGGVLD
jgi:hypothetical protein